MAATARVIWLCACVRYWLYRGLLLSVSLAVIIVKLPTIVSGNEPELSPAGPERTAEIEPRGWTMGRILPVQDFVRGVLPGGVGERRWLFQRLITIRCECTFVVEIIS